MRAIATFLIDPLCWIWLGLLILLLIKDGRKRYLVALNIFFYFTAIPFAGTVCNRIWSVDDTFDRKVTYDAAIVLLGVSDSRWYTSNIGGYFNSKNYFRLNKSADRVLAGISLVKAEHARKLLLGDYTVESFSETELVREFALRHGLSPEQIQIYGEINNTRDEAKGVQVYSKKNSLERLLLITSEIHIRRALSAFKRYGLTPDTYSVNKKDESVSWEFFLPSLSGASQVKGCLYEIVGYMWYRIYV